MEEDGGYCRGVLIECHGKCRGGWKEYVWKDWMDLIVCNTLQLTSSVYYSGRSHMFTPLQSQSE